MKRNRIVRSLLAATAAVSLLALGGCGGGKQPGQPSDSAASGETTTMWALNGGGLETIQKSVDEWNKENPDRQIKVETYANDAFKEKIRTAIGAKNAPTLIYGWGGGVLRDYVKAGSVVDLTAAVKAVTDKMAQGVVANGMTDDKIYGVPNNGTKPVFVYYNKDVFEKAGVQPPKTWDDLMASIPKFKAAGVAPLSIGGQSKWPQLMYISYLTDRIGGPEVFQKVIDQEPGAWSDPAITEALTKIQELVKAGGFVDGFSSINTDSGADIALVHTGKAAMVIQGSWVYPDFKEANEEFVKSGKLGYIEFPAVTGGKGDPTDIVGNPSNYWAVSSAATEAQQKTAMDYIAAKTMSPSYVAGLISEGLVPPMEGAEDEIKKADDADYLMFTYNLAMKAPHFQASWDQALPSAQAQELLTNLDKIFMGEITPAQFVEAMNASIGK